MGLIDLSVVKIDPETKLAYFSLFAKLDNTIRLTKPNKAEGHDYLVQLIIKKLLTLKGSNIFNPSLGCSFDKLLGVTDVNIKETAEQSMPLIVTEITKQIKAKQISDIARGVQLSDNDLLDTIKIKNINFDNTFGGWLVDLEINTKASSFTVTIP